MATLNSFLINELGQDITEYTLLIAFVAVACAGLFISFGGGISGIWGLSNTQLASANTTAAS
jgi:Flp pilus assembly pilin Flp